MYFCIGFDWIYACIGLDWIYSCLGRDSIFLLDNILTGLALSSQPTTLRRFAKMALPLWTGMEKKHSAQEMPLKICFHICSLLTETELQEMSTELISRMEKHVAEGVAVDDALINHHLTDPYIFSESTLFSSLFYLPFFAKL